VGNPRGIKENDVMGRPIPAGTGLPAYKKLQVVIDEKSPTRRVRPHATG
jgi:DNA-directed RNA polymerase subunit beta'